jgi:hypothetical protein
MKVIFPGILMALFIFTSCQKDSNSEEQPKPTCRLTKVTQGLNPDNDSVFMFKYRPDGLPSSISMEFPPDLKFDWMDFVYKPGTSVLEKVWAEGVDDFVMVQFEYNSQGKVAKAKDFVGHEFTYQYNGNGQVNRVDVKRWGSPASIYYTTVFDDNGSLIEWYMKSTADDKIYNAYTIAYSSEENILTGLSKLNLGNTLGMNNLFPGSEFFPFPSKYLVKSVTWKGQDMTALGTYTYVFEKDAKNNVTKAVVNLVRHDMYEGKLLTWKFEYDCDGQ